MAPPSEFDLRAALSEGEGEGGGLNPATLIRLGEERRAQRRSRLLTTAAVVVLVAGGAVGVSQLGGGSDAGGGSAVNANELHRQADGGASQDYAYAPSAAGGKGVPAAPHAAKAKLAQIGCPSVTTAYSLVQDSAQADASARSGPLFRTAVSSAVVCAYGSTLQAVAAPTRHPARLELVGAAASRLATSMASAEESPNPGPCGQGIPNRFTVIGVGASGVAQDPITVDLVGAACAPVLTNGTAVRYDWVPPPDLARRLSALTPTGVPASPTASPTS